MILDVGHDVIRSNIIWCRELATLTILVSIVISGVSYSAIATVVIACVTAACRSIPCYI